MQLLQHPINLAGLQPESLLTKIVDPKLPGEVFLFAAQWECRFFVRVPQNHSCI